MTQSKDMGPGEVARLYGVAIGTLANWRTQDKGPAFKKVRPYRNATVLYDRRKVITWGKRNGYLAQQESAT